MDFSAEVKIPGEEIDRDQGIGQGIRFEPGQDEENGKDSE
jgi:hypothetical protein